MRKLFTFLLIVGLVFIAVNQASAAFNFEEELKKLAADNAEGYLGPFPTAFGMAMNSGLYHSANPHRFFPIPGFDVMVKISLVQVADEDLTYDFMLFDEVKIPVPSGLGIGIDSLTLDPDLIYPDRETPTVFGDDQAVNILPTGKENALTQALLAEGISQATIDLILPQLINEVPDTAIPTIPGSGVDMLPLAMPQVSLGLPMNSEVMLRFIPATEVKEFGEVSFIGIGLKHSVSQYIPVPGLLIPDVSVQYVWQQLKIGDIIESTNTAFNVHASYGINLIILSITPYIGFGVETSNMKVEYEVAGTGSVLDGTPVSFDFDGKNKSRITGGVRLGLPIPLLKVTADYSIGEYNAATIGVGISF